MERLRQIEIDAAEAWWDNLTDEQREAYAALGHHGQFYLDEKIRKARSGDLHENVPLPVSIRPSMMI